jgi:hypothetical protein
MDLVNMELMMENFPNIIDRMKENYCVSKFSKEICFFYI